jgi:hypothetical protein
MEPITCPSCGSKYNPETHELVEDTRLPARITELEDQNRSLRTDLDVSTQSTVMLQTKLDAAQARIDNFDAPKTKKTRDFVVGDK